jgi:1-acyl-sn-glycerol-3-phosphate acyltransferase
VSKPLYAVARALLTPLLRFWFRLRVSGVENIPPEGGAIIAPNHKSFLDAFFVGIATTRHVRYMAKAELFKGPLAWLFPRLGAFPVRRGEADADAVETARIILEQGGIVVVFPEGTRVDEPDALGSPHHGAGRLAFEARVPIVPTAIAGTSRLWLGPIPKPRRVQVSFLKPLDVAEIASARDALSLLIDQEVWPAVQQEYGRLAATPGVVVTVLAALGISGGLFARRRAQPQTPRLLGKLDPRRVRRQKARQRAAERVRSRLRRLRR